MSFFKKFFSKEKEQDLDQGLEKTKSSLFGKLSRAIAGKSKVDDEVLDELEHILISSDVGLDTTVKIIDRINDRVAKDKFVSTQELDFILRDEIVQLLSENEVEQSENYTKHFSAAAPPRKLLTVPKILSAMAVRYPISAFGCNPNVVGVSVGRTWSM